MKRTKLNYSLPAAAVLVLSPFLLAPSEPGCPDCYRDWSEVLEDAELQHYEFSVIPGRYDVVLTATAGDPDLYCTDGTYNDCRPFLDSTEEVCTLDITDNKTISCLVHAYEGPTKFRLSVVYSDTGCHRGKIGNWHYCSDGCLCGYLEGDCDSDDG